jgi:uncharacterized protein
MSMRTPATSALIAATLVMLALRAPLTDAQPAAGSAADPPGDRPAAFVPSTASFDYDRREVMIPMRDGVKLDTVMLVPRGASHAPILLGRTPYGAAEGLWRVHSPRMSVVVPQMFEIAAAHGYIIVLQDVRGKYGSEGEYVMNRPLQGPLNPSSVDHATDTYDTIDWLVKNIPETNGRVGVIGGSYGGFTALMATVRPHPALKVAVPFAPMVDPWMGDDWFHHGAFRQAYTLSYVYDQEATRSNDALWWSAYRDTYEEYLRAGSASAVAGVRGMQQLGFWRKLAAHPAYDSFWQEQALDRILARQPLRVPMLIVCGLFDQEDIYGGSAVFKALAPRDPDGQWVHLVLGPWNHGQGRGEGRHLGELDFEGDTATAFRRDVMQPFLDHYLKDAADPHTPRVLAYETGVDRWHPYDAWPRSCASGCAEPARNLYLTVEGGLRFEPPAKAAGAGYDEYVSDPAKPVPYRERPIPEVYAPDSTWGQWLVDDQRQAATRTDVLVYKTPPLGQPLRLAGEPVAQLEASTSGRDADWVVKLIDVWPEQVPDHPHLGGYQQLLSADILRGRYRGDPAHPLPVTPGEVVRYRLRLPNVSHTFLAGHRIMVQVQSSWFPLYDRNPQSWVENIMDAPPASYIKATQRVWHSAQHASHIEMPVIP